MDFWLDAFASHSELATALFLLQNDTQEIRRGCLGTVNRYLDSVEKNVSVPRAIPRDSKTYREKILQSSQGETILRAIGYQDSPDQEGHLAIDLGPLKEPGTGAELWRLSPRWHELRRLVATFSTLIEENPHVVLVRDQAPRPVPHDEAMASTFHQIYFAETVCGGLSGATVAARYQGEGGWWFGTADEPAVDVNALHAKCRRRLKKLSVAEHLGSLTYESPELVEAWLNQQFGDGNLEPILREISEEEKLLMEEAARQAAAAPGAVSLPGPSTSTGPGSGADDLMSLLSDDSMAVPLFEALLMSLQSRVYGDPLSSFSTSRRMGGAAGASRAPRSAPGLGYHDSDTLDREWEELLREFRREEQVGQKREAPGDPSPQGGKK
jgi:hypothetical protein